MSNMAETKPKPTASSTTGMLAMWNGTVDNEQPYVDYSNGSTNLDGLKTVNAVVEDIRTVSSPPSLLTDGLQIVNNTSTLSAEQLGAGDEPEGKKAIEESYFDEIRQLLTNMTDCKNVFPYSFRIRQNNTTLQNFDVSRLGFNSIPIAHVDRDNVNAPQRVRDSMGEDKGDDLMKHKNWAQVNVWRPIGQAVQKWPLVFVDKRGVPEWDYDTHTARVYPKNDPRTSSMFKNTHETVLKHDDGYLYRYVSKVRPDEALVFFSFHNNPRLVTPHAAFWDYSSPKDAPTRHSIEVRSWAFYD